MAPGNRRVQLEPIKKVKKGTFTRLIKNILKRKVRLTFIAIGLLGSTIASVGTNLFLRILIDDYIEPLLLQKSGDLDFSPLIHAITVFACLLLIGAACSLMYHLLMVKLSNGILRDIREQMFQKMESLPISYFDKNNAGDIMSKYTNDLDTFRQVIAQALPATINGLVTFIFITISMLVLSIDLFCVVILIAFIMIYVTKLAGKFALSRYRKTQKAVGGLNGYVEEMVNGAKEVKVYCYEKRNISEFKNKNSEWKDAVIPADTVSNMMMPVMNALGNVLYIFIAFVGGVIIVNKIPNIHLIGINELSIGMIASFLSFTKTFSHLISELSSQVPFIAQSLSGAERIFDLIDTEKEEDNGKVTLAKTDNNTWVWKDKENIVPLVGHIVLENVNFAYVEDKLVLKNINVYAEKGQKVALVGATGAGKTTITNLINRFYEINNGTITYDGIDVKNIKKEDLRNSLGLVLQDVNLFTGTIMENIRYGKLDATDEECKSAAKLACADTFIEMLPDGYDTVIKGDGGGLSQGQKQLISIARAAVANPPCLILDEATSSIDTRTEKLVQKGMDSIMKGRTVFVIAHRLSTIKDSDVIMVMQNGEIVERGTHESLLEKKGHYYELYTGKVELD